MKHCAKKLLGLVFALALCLAVGGNALADGPEAADVWMLSDAWMLADEPNVTNAPDTTTVGDLANDGYTVTIPTTVEVDSETKETDLKVTAAVKQLRTLNITLASNHNWNLQHESGQAQAGYSLKTANPAGGESKFSSTWFYDEDGTSTGTNKPTLSLIVGQKASGVSDITWSEGFTIPMIVQVKDTSQATMSGTYTDTVCFEFDLTKQCFTYIINVYGQEVELTSEASGTSSDFGKKYKGLQAVNMAGNANAPYTEQYVLEYGINPDGTVMGAAPGAWQHKAPVEGETRKAVDGTEKTFTAEDAADYALRWETLDQEPIDPATDYANGDKTKTKTIDRNLVRKWYWLDVNGATDYVGDSEGIHGNQGARISGYVNMQVSVDGTNWSSWFWQSDGDDYWGQFPYGIHFKLGFHHVKNGYVYDMGTDGGVKIIANKQKTETAPGEKEGDTTYYVYKGTLTGEPTGEDSYNNVRYCYIPCYKKGLTYMANQGTGGKEDVNGANKPRTNVLYQEGDELESPEQLKIAPPSTDMVFAGWSTKSTYTTGDTLYQPGALVRTVNWENYTDQKDLNKRPQLNGTQDTQKRELYAIWGRKVDITIQFEDEKGYSMNDGTGPVAQLGGTMAGSDFVLKDQVVADGADWVLDLNNAEVKNAIEAATNAAKEAAKDTRTSTDNETVWKIGENFKKECTIHAVDLQSGTPTLMIQRRRYLLSVISVDVETTTVKTIATNANEEAYGTFDVTINDGQTDLGVKGKSHCQVGLNYGAKYTVNEMKGVGSYSPMNAVILKSLRPNDELERSWFTDGTVDSTGVYTNWMTGKESSIHYYKTGEDDPKDGYVGDPVRVAFNDSISSSDTPVAGPTLAPGLSGPTVGDADADGDDTAGDTGEDITQPPSGTGLTLRYHANFVADDAVEEAVKTVACAPGADVVLKTCMFKRAGYTFTGWNTEKDGMGRAYKANGVPVTDWSDGDTVDLYAQWEKTVPLKPVVSGFDEDTGLFDPFAPPEELDPGFGIDPDADPADEEGPADDADAVDDAPAVADEEAAAAPPEELDFGFGIDPDAAVGGPAPFVRW